MLFIISSVVLVEEKYQIIKILISHKHKRLKKASWYVLIMVTHVMLSETRGRDK